MPKPPVAPDAAPTVGGASAPAGSSFLATTGFGASGAGLITCAFEVGVSRCWFWSAWGFCAAFWSCGFAWASVAGLPLVVAHQPPAPECLPLALE